MFNLNLLPRLARSTALVGTAFVLSSLLAEVTHAQPAPDGPPRQPPAEALAACKSLAANAACSFTGPRGAMTGNCFAPQGKPLACRPTHAQPPGRPASGGRP